MHDGRLVAYFSIHDRVPRHYTEAEVSLLRDVAMRIWDAVQRSRAEVALRASEARLQVLYAQEQAARAQAEAASRLKDEFRPPSRTSCACRSRPSWGMRKCCNRASAT